MHADCILSRHTILTATQNISPSVVRITITPRSFNAHNIGMCYSLILVEALTPLQKNPPSPETSTTSLEISQCSHPFRGCVLAFITLTVYLSSATTLVKPPTYELSFVALPVDCCISAKVTLYAYLCAKSPPHPPFVSK
jgi:hypothetical protein